MDQLLFATAEQRFAPATLLCMLQILQEAQLIRWQDQGTLYHIETPKAAGKADLQQTPTMQYLVSLGETTV